MYTVYCASSRDAAKLMMTMMMAEYTWMRKGVRASSRA
ncbi:Uncharacterised protein [Mycobacterium tuberculosis]|nr:Uncharacterised protein [Mycobacterium tuberculosis]